MLKVAYWKISPTALSPSSQIGFSAFSICCKTFPAINSEVLFQKTLQSPPEPVFGLLVPFQLLHSRHSLLHDCWHSGSYLKHMSASFPSCLWTVPHRVQTYRMLSLVTAYVIRLNMGTPLMGVGVSICWCCWSISLTGWRREKRNWALYRIRETQL